MSKNSNSIGIRYNRLTILKEVPPYIDPKTGAKKSKVQCSCLCGTIIEVRLAQLKNGKTKSCGCLQKEVVKGLFTKYRYGYNTPEYNSYNGMKDRCLNLNHKSYVNYGGRGIKVCVRWLESFDNFLTDMGRKPTPKHSLERNDVNKGYEPTNCRWATVMEQSKNKTNSNNTVGVHFDRLKNLWVASLMVGGKYILHKSFKNEPDAVAARLQAEQDELRNTEVQKDKLRPM